MPADIPAVRAFLSAHPLLYAAVMDLDKQPQVYPAEVCFLSEEAICFAAAKCERFYGALSLARRVSLCVRDGESGTVFRMMGVPVFTEDEETVARCLRENASLRERWGTEPKMVIAWFLKDAVCQFQYRDGREETVRLGTPEGLLVGIRIKKKTELRDRLSSLLAEREEMADPPKDGAELEKQKLYDGALLYFAETAKELWPRMDIRPIQRSALFETYDEREAYVALAKKRVGNALIDKPEDLTYWLDRERLAEKGS